MPELPGRPRAWCCGGGAGPAPSKTGAAIGHPLGRLDDK